MENSGAVLAWHYFNGFANPVPKFIQLIQDRDLWRWQYRAESEPLFYALSDMYQIPNYKDFSAYLDAAALQQAIEHGKKLISKIKAWCQLTADKAELHSFSDIHKCVVIALEVNSDQYVSELAEEIYTRQHADIVMLWHRLADNKYKMSFRNDNPAVNLSDLAQILGGGGHPRASGATVDYMPSDLLGDPRKPLN
jgi:oligoribonuclease NrnB/cAMP/cGMP phosphodiesterase (DHH superfamily)